MRVIVIVMVLYAVGIASITAGKRPEGISAQGRRVKTWYRLQIDELKSDATALLKRISNGENSRDVQTAFANARRSYKRLETLAEYFTPVTAKALNGPALDEVDANERDVVELPEGFQVMEAMIFPQLNVADTATLRMEAARMVSNVKRLERTAELLAITDVQLFDALRHELIRITALGISGFDSPIAAASVPETVAALEGCKAIWQFYKEDIDDADKKLSAQIQQQLDKAMASLRGSFNEFDRLTFIRDHINPLSESILACRKVLAISAPAGPSFLQPEAANFFFENGVQRECIRCESNRKNTEAQAELGKKLFYDPVLSFNSQRSCASCHKPGMAFTDGLPVAASLNGSAVMRNTPTLLNAALQSSQFYDLRVAYLEDQVADVVNNPAEMHGSLEQAVKKLQGDEAYRKLFNRAFGDMANMHSKQLKVAIAAYIRSLVVMDSRFDRYMRGEEQTLAASEVRGFNLFMGKAKCGTCHFAPLFNGNVPPRYEKTEAEVLGVPTSADSHEVDTDEGKFNLYKVALHRHAFKTPTLRNIALTAPYMHNGIYRTLDEVMEFYNNGGGAGLGITLDNQTLPTDSLHLTKEEKEDIIAFLETLTDEPK
ncbi:cytochrome C peroxidase [Chitinophaga sedimenti]|uniref:cytochrome c peroxidase n=1 Tax=Chitinophaga sedimenti TaxID=2033606 RepID=UPI002003D07F|nr:cytochrome c peroxidase [Chitinophaga sedimenti]MCK7558672.1 cytochrome C peroxidase [Chitinophaga sedimenti]